MLIYHQVVASFCVFFVFFAGNTITFSLCKILWLVETNQLKFCSNTDKRCYALPFTNRLTWLKHTVGRQEFNITADRIFFTAKRLSCRILGQVPPYSFHNRTQFILLLHPWKNKEHSISPPYPQWAPTTSLPKQQSGIKCIRPNINLLQMVRQEGLPVSSDHSQESHTTSVHAAKKGN